MISVVIPVYNEGPSLIVLCDRLIEVLVKLGRYEIVLVDDRSRDSSWQVMKAIASANPNIKIARLCRNFGQHSALTAGLSLANGEYVVMMDCDGQDDPQNITALYEALIAQDVVVVYGKRKSRKDSFVKQMASKAINGILQWLSGMTHDSDIGTFRIMKKFAVDAYLSLPEKNRFIGGMFYWLNFQSASIDVIHQPRSSGKSNYTLGKLVKLARLGVLSSSTRILSLGTYIGLISSVLSVGLGIYYVALKYIYDIPLGYTSIIVSIFFVGSIIMLLLGIIGEYLREIFEEIKGRPNYIIEETVNLD